MENNDQTTPCISQCAGFSRNHTSHKGIENNLKSKQMTSWGNGGNSGPTGFVEVGTYNQMYISVPKKEKVAVDNIIMKVILRPAKRWSLHMDCHNQHSIVTHYHHHYCTVQTPPPLHHHTTPPQSLTNRCKSMRDIGTIYINVNLRTPKKCLNTPCDCEVKIPFVLFIKTAKGFCPCPKKKKTLYYILRFVI